MSTEPTIDLLPSVLPEIFFWQDYIGNHPDLPRHNITTKDKAIDHYITHGHQERRNLYGTLYKLCFKYKKLFKCNAYISCRDLFLSHLFSKYPDTISIQKYFEYGLLFSHLLTQLLPQKDSKILDIGSHGFLSRHSTNILTFDPDQRKIDFLSKYHRQEPTDIYNSSFSLISIFLPFHIFSSDSLLDLIKSFSTTIVFFTLGSEIIHLNGTTPSLYYQTPDLCMYLLIR